MATVTGSAGGQAVKVTASSQLQAAFAQQILTASAASASASQSAPPQSIQANASGPITLTSSVAVDTSTVAHVVSGSADVPVAQIVMAGSNGAYVTGETRLSTVIAADHSSSAIVNSNPNSGLIAITGAGPNAIAGFAGVNQFVTALEGHDVVIMNGVSNDLTTGGQDAVLVGGPSTTTAAAGGADNVLMTSGTTLAFTNNSALVSTVTGAAGAAVSLFGSGSTLVVAGDGAENFNVFSATGNVSLRGSLSGSDTFTFMQDANNATSTASHVVSNFTERDTVQLRGYAGYTVQDDQSNPNGSVMTLSDGTTVTFTDASAGTVQAHLKIV